MVLVHEIERQVAESDLPEVVNCIRRALADEHELEIHTVVLIKSGTIPRTSSGKIQRGACKVAFESGQLAVVGASTLDQDLETETDGMLSETPQTTAEKKLADIWQEVLGGPPPYRHANFFSLGGNSLLAAQVVARILDVFHVELPLSTLFECPTLAALAARISELSASPDDIGRSQEGADGEDTDSSCSTPHRQPPGKAGFLSALRSCVCGSWSKFILGARSTIFPWMCVYKGSVDRRGVGAVGA